MQVTDEDFVQPAALWEVLGRTPGQQDNLVRNVSGHLSAAKEPTRKRTYEMFSRINKDLGARIEKETEKLAPRLAN
jgi:catalase